MKINATRARGILIFIGALIILGVIAFFAVTSNNSTASSNTTSNSNGPKTGSVNLGGSVPVLTPTPKVTPTATPTPFIYDKDADTRDNLVLAAVGYVAGVDPTITPDQIVATLSPNLDANSTAQIRQIQGQYNWAQVESEQYLRIATVQSQTFTPVSGADPNKYKAVDSVQISISKNGKPAVFSPGFENWTVVVDKQSNTWIILSISKDN